MMPSNKKILEAAELWAWNGSKWGIEDFLACFDELSGENHEEDKLLILKAIDLLTHELPLVRQKLIDFARGGFII